MKKVSEHVGGGLATALGGYLLRRLVGAEERGRFRWLGFLLGRRRGLGRLLRLRLRAGRRRGAPASLVRSSSSSSSSNQSLTSTSSPEAVSTVRATASRTLWTLGFRFPLTLTVTWTSNSSGPIRKRSPAFNSCSAVNRSPLRKVPLLLPKSRTAARASPVRITQWWRLTRSLCGRNWHSSPRPIKNSGPATGMVCPGVSRRW